jgi:hypothetical protein
MRIIVEQVSEDWQPDFKGQWYAQIDDDERYPDGGPFEIRPLPHEAVKALVAKLVVGMA